ncbi:hypothetical protein ACJX0J_018706, partial [Zea mays]
MFSTMMMNKGQNNYLYLVIVLKLRKLLKLHSLYHIIEISHICVVLCIKKCDLKTAINNPRINPIDHAILSLNYGNVRCLISPHEDIIESPAYALFCSMRLLKGACVPPGLFSLHTSKVIHTTFTHLC